jgi:hypothetical protein
VYSHEAAYQKIHAHHAYVKRTFPISFRSFAPWLESGLAYICKRDAQYRPIILINYGKIASLNGKSTVESMLNVVHYLMEFAVERCMVPGRVE